MTRTAEARPHVVLDEEALLAPGTALGRYVIVGRLGAGGMSVVYQAYDGELDRGIAIKVMRTRYWDAAGQLRVRREGQAMAKLSHPNVVQVHDVGSLGDQTFIAMELIDGVTVKQWLAAEPRTWRAILDVLVQAGRGIAAAHAAGVVHRDIKPANVLVDRLGRARVTDFGIARPADVTTDEVTTAPDDLPTDPDEVSATPLSTPITRTGAVVGTPAYMAPEQKLGRSGPRADQFSFCVMAREALVGRRGATDDDGDPASGAPRWLLAAIARGLSTDPADRHPSMDALLAAMTADPSARRRKVLTIAACVLIAGGSAAALAMRPSAASPCGGNDELAAAAWNPALAEATARGFAASGRSHAEATFARVDRLLIARRDDWARRRRAVCEATRVRGDQSEHLLDLRMQCLDRRLAELQALTAVLAGQADGDVVDHAVQAVAGQRDLGVCDDAATLAQAHPLPDDPAARAQIDALRGELDRVAALAGAGKYRAALAAAIVASAEAARLAWPPAHARALFWRGRLESYDGRSAASEATLEAAIQRAAEAGDDDLAAEAGLELIYVLGYELARPAEALQTGDVVDAMVRRAGGAPARRALLAERIGVVLWAKGALAEAQQHLERALALYRTLPGEEIAMTATLTNLGNVLADQHRADEARRMYEEELAIVERTLGPDHPSAARALANLGTVLAALGRADDALAADLRALAIWERTYGDEHPMIAMVTNNLGELLRNRGEPATALPYCERAMRIGEATLPDGHPVRAYHLLCTANALVDLGRGDEAARHFERALAIRTAVGGDPVELAEARFGLARARWPSDRRGALVLARQARDAYAVAGDPAREELAAVDAWLRDRR